MASYPSLPSSPLHVPVTQPRVYRPPTRRRARRFPLGLLALVWGGGLAGVAFLALLAGLGYFAYFQVNQRILPGVAVGSTRLDGLTPTQAALRLNQAWNVDRAILVEDGLQSYPVQAAALGLSLDIVTTAQQAYQVGHNGPFLSEVGQFIESLQHGQQIEPQVHLDLEAARAGLIALAPQYSRAPQDASLQLQGTNLVALPGSFGYTINTGATLAALAANPKSVLVTGTLKIQLMPVQPQVIDVSAALIEGQRILDTPFTVHLYDPVRDERLNWNVTRETLATWLHVTNSTAGPQIGLDSQAVTAYLESQAAGLDPERWIDVQHWGAAVAGSVQQHQEVPLVLINHHPTVYTIQPGDTLLKIGWKVEMPYWRILEANPGLDTNRLTSGQQITIPSKDDLLPLPVVADKRIVISLEHQRLWAYENGALISEQVISTGIDRSPTQPGVFQIQTHDLNAYASVWDLYMPHFMGIYEAWPGFMNGIHGLPTLSTGQRLWANVLGRPASYGCIILNLEAAEWLYNWAEAGVVVEIR